MVGKVSIEKKPYKRAIPKLNYEKSFFSPAASLTVSDCEMLENILN